MPLPHGDVKEFSRALTSGHLLTVFKARRDWLSVCARGRASLYSSEPCIQIPIWGHTLAHLNLSLFSGELCLSIPFVPLDLGLLRGAVDRNVHVMV